jgi:hypothetical protein
MFRDRRLLLICETSAHTDQVVYIPKPANTLLLLGSHPTTQGVDGVDATQDNKRNFNLCILI